MFTDKSLRALQPRKTTYRVFEKSVDKGLCVQLTPAGGIYFYMQYQSPVTDRHNLPFPEDSRTAGVPQKRK